jgi:hypothetical protein
MPNQLLQIMPQNQAKNYAKKTMPKKLCQKIPKTTPENQNNSTSSTSVANYLKSSKLR